MAFCQLYHEENLKFYGWVSYKARNMNAPPSFH